MKALIKQTKHVCQLFGFGGLLCAAFSAHAASNACATVVNVCGESHGVTNSQVGLSDCIAVEVDHLSPQQQTSVTKGKSTVVLFLNDTPLRGLCSDAYLSTNPENAILRFHLQRTDATRLDWVAFLGHPQHFTKITKVSVGFADSAQLSPADEGTNEITFVVIHERWFWFCLVFSVIMLIAVWMLARNSEALRDDGPAPPSQGVHRPYSLARWQMAFWFVLVLPAFLFLWLITGSLDTLTQSMLVLMGVSAGTAVLSHAQAAGKRSGSAIGILQQRQEELLAKCTRTPGEEAELVQTQEAIKRLAPASNGFMADVLQDDVGVSLHRFQMFVWTIVMGIIFVTEVYEKCAMPDFSGTLLGLMGISSGTYLGFMLTESLQAKVP